MFPAQVQAAFPPFFTMRLFSIVPCVLALLLLCVSGCSAAPATKPLTKPIAKSTAPISNFKLSVYFNAHAHPQNLPLSRVLADLAGHGVTRIVVLSQIYNEWAPLGLHRLAKEWGIEIVISNLLNPLTYDKNVSTATLAQRNEKDMKALIARVNAQPFPEVVTAWYAADEAEYSFKKTDVPDAEIRLRNFVSLIKRLDPKRKVIVNHDARNSQWGGFFKLGEDESWCSVFWANSYATNFLKKQLAGLQANSKVPVTLVYGAQNMSGESGEILRELLQTYGLENISPEEARKRSVRQDVADYIVNSQRVGAQGAALFTYDGYYDYTYYSMVDERGRSKEGKMEGVRDAVETLSANSGAPSLQVKITPSAFLPLPRTLTIETIAAPNATTKTPLQSVQVFVSDNGGHSWQAVKAFSKPNQTVTFELPHDWQRPNWMMVRARVFDGNKYSLWSVWNALPWSPPNAS